jgi:hypothetical protein
VKHPLALLLLPLFTLPGQALEIRSYNATVHDRFTGFPGSPVMNPSFLYDATKFTGVGWGALQAHKEYALVSPRHFVCATHNVPPLASSIRFIDSTGALVQRTVTTLTTIASDTAGNCDLTLGTLDSALPSTVKPLPFLNLANEAAYNATNLMIFGFKVGDSSPIAGHGAVVGFDSADVDGVGAQGDTRLYHFDYNSIAGTADDCFFTPTAGDSGSPSFANVAGQPAIMGVHCTYALAGSITENYDTFVPHYEAKLNVLLSPQGYRMRPVNFTATTLGTAIVTDPVTLRQAYPGTVKFTLTNSGAQTTGNAEMVLTFAAGQAPATVTATGWVVESIGSGMWSIRKALMSSGESIEVDATWTAMPDVASLGVSFEVKSDTVTSSLQTPSIPLLPTYLEWANGLAEAGQGDDPDDDGMVNLLEYAFGSDPESGSMLLSSGDPVQPVITDISDIITLTYPERSDAVARGLTYEVETSTDLDTLTGATTLPSGAVSSTQAFVPDVPGFVKHVITWPADAPARFARVKVELSE